MTSTNVNNVNNATVKVTVTSGVKPEENKLALKRIYTDFYEHLKIVADFCGLTVKTLIGALVKRNILIPVSEKVKKSDIFLTTNGPCQCKPNNGRGPKPGWLFRVTRLYKINGLFRSNGKLPETVDELLHYIVLVDVEHQAEVYVDQVDPVDVRLFRKELGQFVYKVEQRSTFHTICRTLRSEPSCTTGWETNEVDKGHFFFVKC